MDGFRMLMFMLMIAVNMRMFVSRVFMLVFMRMIVTVMLMRMSMVRCFWRVAAAVFAHIQASSISIDLIFSSLPEHILTCVDEQAAHFNINFSTSDFA